MLARDGGDIQRQSLFHVHAGVRQSGPCPPAVIRVEAGNLESLYVSARLPNLTKK